MTDEIVFYTNPTSRGRIARWMLEETGCAYRTELLDFDGSMKSADYRAVNPMGKVPAIRHGDTVVTEAAAICAYLADAFADARLAPPPGDRLRGPYYRWLFFAAGPLEAATTDRSLGFEPPAERQRMVGYGSFDDVMATLERAVAQREFIVGDRFSAADVYVGMHVGWGLQFGSIERRPAFEQYWARLGERPALQRANRIDDALMAERAAPQQADAGRFPAGPSI